jgi:hypothetical protein
MFPLGTVLMPYAVLPLHVFEPRYRALVRDVLDGDQEFGIVLIERGSEVGGGDVRFEVGTLAHVVQFAPLADGRFALAVVGAARLKIERWLPEDPYPRAEVLELPEVDDRAGDSTALRAAALDGLREVLALAAQLPGSTEVAMPDVATDPAQAAYEIAAFAALGPLDAQRVLELPDPSSRLSTLRAHLDETAMVLRARLAGA